MNRFNDFFGHSPWMQNSDPRSGLPNWQPSPSMPAAAPSMAAATAAALPPMSAATPTGPISMSPGGQNGGMQGLGGAGALSGLTPDQLRWQQLLEANKPDPRLGWAQAGIQGIGMLGNLGLGAYGLYQGKQAFDFQKNMAERNYQNSVTDYNTNRADRVMGRYSSEERVQNKDAIEKEIRDSQLPTSRR